MANPFAEFDSDTAVAEAPPSANPFAEFDNQAAPSSDIDDLNSGDPIRVANAQASMLGNAGRMLDTGLAAQRQSDANDVARIKVSPTEISKLEGNTPDETFEHYQERNPTPSQLTAARLLPLADTPEKKQQLARFIQDKNLDLPVGSAAGDLYRSVSQGPLPDGEHLLQAHPTSAIGKTALGVEHGVENLGNFFLSPFGIATLGIGELPVVAQRAVALGFSAQMASQLPDQSIELLRELNKPEKDWTKIGELVTEAAGGAGFAALGAAHGLAPKTDFIAARLAKELNKAKLTPKSMPVTPIVQSVNAAPAPDMPPDPKKFVPAKPPFQPINPTPPAPKTDAAETFNSMLDYFAKSKPNKGDLRGLIQGGKEIGLSESEVLAQLAERTKISQPEVEKPLSPTATRGIEKLVELSPEEKSDPRMDEPGVTRKATPNTITVQFRDRNSIPIGEAELTPSGDSLSQAQRVVNRIRTEAGNNPNVSIRESAGVLTDERGHGIIHFTDSPNGAAFAKVEDLIKARQQTKEPQPSAPAAQLAKRKKGFTGLGAAGKKVAVVDQSGEVMQGKPVERKVTEIIGEKPNPENLSRPSPATSDHEQLLASADLANRQARLDEEQAFKDFESAKENKKKAYSKGDYEKANKLQLKVDAAEKRWLEMSDKTSEAMIKIADLKERTEWDSAEPFNQEIWRDYQKLDKLPKGKERDSERQRLLDKIEEEWTRQTIAIMGDKERGESAVRGIHTLNSGVLSRPLEKSNQISNLAKTAARTYEQREAKKAAESEIQGMDLAWQEKPKFNDYDSVGEIQNKLEKARAANAVNRKAKSAEEKRQADDAAKESADEAIKAKELSKSGKLVWRRIGSKADPVGKWQPMEGKKFFHAQLPGIEMGIFKDASGWVISEQTTGHKLAGGKTMEAAKSELAAKASQFGVAKIKELIATALKDAPPKPVIEGDVATPPAAVAKVAEHIAEVASGDKVAKPEAALDATTGVRAAKEIKSELVQRLEKAIEDAPAATDDQAAALNNTPKLTSYKDFIKEGEKGTNEQRIRATKESDVENSKRRAAWVEAIKKENGLTQVTIDIPGDGTFTVWNTKQALQEVLDRAKKLSTATESKQPTAFTNVRPTGNIPADVWVESSEPTHKVTVSAGNIKTQEPGKRIEIKGLEGKELYLTSNGKEFKITEPQTGFSIGRGAKISDAVKDAEQIHERLKEKKMGYDEVVKRNVSANGKLPSPEPIQKPSPITEAQEMGGDVHEVRQGPGGRSYRAKSSDEQPESYDATSLKNAVAEMERVTHGLPEAPETEKRDMGKAWIKAGETLVQKPHEAERILGELQSDPSRGLTDSESAILLRHKVGLENALNDAAERTWTAETAQGKRAAQNEVQELSNKLKEFLDLVKARGSEWGREGRWRQAMAKEDYSFATQERLYRAARGGEDLTKTPEGMAQLERIQKDAEALKRNDDEIARLRAENAAKEKAIAQLEAQKVLDDALKGTPVAAPVEPYIQTLVKKVVKSIENQAKDARDRIKARRSEGRTFNDPTAIVTLGKFTTEDVADAAIIGAEYLAHGIEDFAAWSKVMKDEFGEKILPKLKEIFAKSKSFTEKTVIKEVLPKDRDKVRKSVKSMTVDERQARVEGMIKKRLSEGEKDSVTPLVQGLARLFVERGVKDRNELLDKVHGVLESIDPAITRDEAMDAISGYGDYKQLSKDRVSVQLRDYKRQYQILGALRDMEAGKPSLRSGIEKTKWTEEQGKLLKQLNEAKFKFQVPITDPETQLKSALDTAKTRVEGQIKEYQRRLDESDFEKKPRRELVRDPKLLELESQRNKIKNRFIEARMAAERAQRNWFQKATGAIANLNRVSILGHVSVLEHLSGAALENFATRPVGTAIAQLMRFSKTLDDIRRKAVYEGSLGGERAGIAGTLKSYAALMAKLKTGKSELDWLHDAKTYPKEFAQIVQNCHGAIKEPVRQGIYARSMELRTKAAEKMGLDPQHDEVLAKVLSQEAYNDANMDIFMGDNFLTKALHNNVGAYLRGQKGDPGLAKFTADVLDILFPIVNVSTNLAIRKFRLAAGLPEAAVRIGVAKARGELANGAEKLTPRDAELITRAMKYGLFGIALGIYAWRNKDQFGGIYVPGANAPKNKKVKTGDIALPDGMYFDHISHHFAHGPVGGYMNLIADASRLYDSEVKGNKNSPWSAASDAAFFAMFAGVKDLPAFSTVARLASPFKTAGQKAGEMVRNMFIFGGLQDIAAHADQPNLTLAKFFTGTPTPRSPKTFVQEIESGIPVLRETVPAKGGQASDSDQNASFFHKNASFFHKSFFHKNASFFHKKPASP